MDAIVNDTISSNSERRSSSANTNGRTEIVSFNKLLKSFLVASALKIGENSSFMFITVKQKSSSRLPGTLTPANNLMGGPRRP
jgi:hypothetical protein